MEKRAHANVFFESLLNLRIRGEPFLDHARTAIVRGVSLAHRSGQFEGSRPKDTFLPYGPVQLRSARFD